jgi:preprotein translocase subunit SecG
MSIVLGILTFILILVSVFLVLIVLMQKSKDGGIGSALGGGAAEAAFGADTNNVLVQATKYSAILFFVLAFLLYLGRIYERKADQGAAGGALPSITAPAATGAPSAAAPAPAVAVPATPAPAAAAPAPAPEAPKK